MSKYFKIALIVIFSAFVLFLAMFYLTTMSSKPTAVKVEVHEKMNYSNADVNLIIVSPELVYAIDKHTNEIQKFDITDRSYSEIQAYLKEKKKDSDFAVVIKAGLKSTYQTQVDLLDQMTICNIKFYSLTEASSEDLKFAQNKF